MRRRRYHRTAAQRASDKRIAATYRRQNKRQRRNVRREAWGKRTSLRQFFSRVIHGY